MYRFIWRSLIGIALMLGITLGATALVARAESGAPVQLPGLTSPQASGLQLSLDVSQSAPGFYLAEARLHDAKGQPVTGAPIAFYEKTTFGRLLLETVKTNKQGYASSEEKIPNHALNLVAAYCESPQACQVETEAQLAVDVKDNNVPFDSRPADLNTPYAPPVPVALMLLTLTGVWSTFAVVVHQIYRIRRPTKKPPQQGQADVFSHGSPHD